MNIFGKIKSWNANNRAFNELSNMSDKSLSDLGISRSDISAAIRGELNK